MILSLLLSCGLWLGADDLAGIDQDGDGVGYPDDCDDQDPEIGLDRFFQDNDGDRYGDPALGEGCDWSFGLVGDGSDCDDADPARNPDTLWYPDADGDGYGSPGETAASCEQPPAEGGVAWAATADDCDDTAAAVHPGADEVCDNVDNDCDAVLDNDYALDAETWYLDDDEDGYGGAETLTACSQPADYLPEGDDGSGAGDCDDEDPTVNPAAPEICGDGIDNDCDGEAGACEMSLPGSTLGFVGEKTWDYLGFTVSGRADLDGDGAPDLIAGAKQAGEDEQGEVYVVYGPLTGAETAVITDAAGAIAQGEAGDKLGQGLVAADLNGDGIGDLVASSSAREDEQGATFVFYGPLSPGEKGPAEIGVASADAVFTGQKTYERAGAYVGSPGDLDGDGLDELLIGATSNNTAETNSGCVYLLYGPASTGGDLVDADAQLTGAGEEDRVGESLPWAGDLDGDGLDDLAIGARQNDDADESSGSIYLLFGAPSGVVSLSAADAQIVGAQTGEQAGYAVSGAGDVDGDGYGDFLVGANYATFDQTDQGAAYLFLGPGDDAKTVDDAVAVVTGAEGGLLGTRVAGGTDFDGDGAADLLVGASRTGDSDEGAAYLVPGPIEGTIYAPDAAAATFEGAANDKIGQRALQFAGALTTDGGPALLMGSYLNDDNGTDAGGVWVIRELGL